MGYTTEIPSYCEVYLPGYAKPSIVIHDVYSVYESEDFLTVYTHEKSLTKVTVSNWSFYNIKEYD